MATIHDLIPWHDPVPARQRGGYTTLRQLQQEMDSLFDQLFPGNRSEETTGKQASSILIPQLDIAESEKHYHLSLDIPGIDEKDVDISVENGVLTVTGERTQQEVVKDKTFHRVERSHGTFRRSVKLPEQVNVDKITASFTNGVLDIDIPKIAEKKDPVKKIAIGKK